LDIPEDEINETIAIAMTVGASKARALAGKFGSPGEPVRAEDKESPAECKT